MSQKPEPSTLAKLTGEKRSRTESVQGEPTLSAPHEQRVTRKQRVETTAPMPTAEPSEDTKPTSTHPSAVCTFTFTECAENHIGNEQIGKKLPTGPSLEDLKKTAAKMVSWLKERGIKGWKIELHIFSEKLDAGILILKGLDAINWTWCPPSDTVDDEADPHADEDEVDEPPLPKDPKTFMMDCLDWDKKFYNSRRKVVQNKVARHNLCFTDSAQEPDYSTGKGRTYTFASLPPFMRALRSFYSENILVEGKPLAQPLIAEANKYYDIASTYIGWHGDVERTIVAGYRVGGPFALHYWAFDGVTSLTTEDGATDMIWSFEMEDGWGYIMSFGASGQNWRKNCQHLRHAAGKPSVLAKKQDRVPKSWASGKKNKATAKATPDTFVPPSKIKPLTWEAAEDDDDVLQV